MSDADIASRLKAARKENRLSQAAAAKLLGITRPAVTQWESGKNSPSTDHLIKAAIVYAVDVGWLINGKGSESKRTGHPEPRLDRDLLRLVAQGYLKAVASGADRPAPENAAEGILRLYDWIAANLDVLSRDAPITADRIVTMIQMLESAPARLR